MDDLLLIQIEGQYEYLYPLSLHGRILTPVSYFEHLGDILLHDVSKKLSESK